MRAVQMTVARALIAGALAKARPNDPAAWEDLHALWTLARSLEPGEAARPEVVKVVVDARQCALYFSRSLIPYPRREGEVAPLAHIGIYGFSAQTLQRFARLAETPLERAEGLEQLRALWHGIPIEVGVVDHRPAAVDTPEDLERVRRLFAEEQRRNG